MNGPEPLPIFPVADRTTVLVSCGSVGLALYCDMLSSSLYGDIISLSLSNFTADGELWRYGAVVYRSQCRD